MTKPSPHPVRIFEGTLRERAIRDLEIEGRTVTESNIATKMRYAGDLVEDFPDPELGRIPKKPYKGPLETLGLLRGIFQDRRWSPISFAEIQAVSRARIGYRRNLTNHLIHLWKCGLIRRFYRGLFIQGEAHGKGLKGGTKHGIHYILQ